MENRYDTRIVTFSFALFLSFFHSFSNLPPMDPGQSFIIHGDKFNKIRINLPRVADRGVALIESGN